MIQVCPDAIKRTNYEIVWISKDMYNFENKIYIKAFYVKGYGPLIPFDDISIFKEYAKN